MEIVLHNTFGHKSEVEDAFLARWKDNNFIGYIGFSLGDTSAIFEGSKKGIEESFVFFVIIVNFKILIFNSKNLAKVLILGVVGIDFKLNFSLGPVDKRKHLNTIIAHDRHILKVDFRHN